MAEKKKRRRFRIPLPKINDDFMTTAVVLSLAYCIRVVEKGLDLAAMGQDASGIVVPALALFGTELALCALMKVHDRNITREDKKAEESRERRRMKAENETQEKETYIEGVKRHENE